MATEERTDEGERLLQRAARPPDGATAVADPPAAPPRPSTSNNGAPAAGAFATPQAPAAAPKQRGRRRRIIIPLLAVVLSGAIFGVTYWRDQTLYVSTDNAQVAGSLVQVGSINAGRVSAVNVDIGSTVQQGETIATVILPTTLSVTSSGTPQLGFQATQDQQAAVVAPMNGVVVQRLANPGDTVAQGQAIVTIVDPNQLWVQAQIEETKISRVKVGQPVDVHVDTLGVDLPGRVTAVDRASAASFSLLPQGNTSGNFTKVTQLVPVKIAVDYGNQPLVLGSSVEVKIHVQ
jgi:multidrug resistance efflux pump